MRAALAVTQHIVTDFPEEGMRGTISVSPFVLADSAGIASADIDGRVGFITPARDRIKALAIRQDEHNIGKGHWSTRNGICVTLGDAVVDADVTIAVRRGANVPTLAEELRAWAGEACDRMLGLHADAVSVQVRAITDPASPEIE